MFFNVGIIERQPNFDAVFPNFANDVNQSVENEKIKSIEFGYGYIGNSFKLNVNVYSTIWDNRFLSRSIRVDSDTGLDFDRGTAQFSDVDVSHKV